MRTQIHKYIIIHNTIFKVSGSEQICFELSTEKFSKTIFGESCQYFVDNLLSTTYFLSELIRWKWRGKIIFYNINRSGLYLYLSEMCTRSPFETLNNELFFFKWWKSFSNKVKNPLSFSIYACGICKCYYHYLQVQIRADQERDFYLSFGLYVYRRTTGDVGLLFRNCDNYEPKKIWGRWNAP